MTIAIILRRQTEDERKQHEADGLFLFKCQDENLATGRLGIIAASFHSSWRRTCTERNFRRIFSS